MGVLQGGLDGGIDIPHSEKRFIGYDTEGKKLDAETLQRYIYGGNVSDYMEWLQEENGDKYHTHFKKALAEDLDADGIEDMYKEVGILSSEFQWVRGSSRGLSTGDERSGGSVMVSAEGVGRRKQLQPDAWTVCSRSWQGLPVPCD